MDLQNKLKALYPRVVVNNCLGASRSKAIVSYLSDFYNETNHDKALLQDFANLLRVVMHTTSMCALNQLVHNRFFSAVKILDFLLRLVNVNFLAKIARVKETC